MDHKKSLSLDGNQVHIWKARLDLPEKEIVMLKGLLSDQELKKAAAFRLDDHARRFIACRGQLRKCLSEYTGTPPERLIISHTSLGKPFLDGNRMEFSVSHSEDLALFAIAQRNIGVDLEHLGSVHDIEVIAKRLFSSQENALLGSLQHPEMDKEFLRRWTLREAYLKATGEGIGGLSRICFELAPEGFKDGDGTCWHASSLTPAEGFFGAIVVESGPDSKNDLRHFETRDLL